MGRHCANDLFGEQAGSGGETDESRGLDGVHDVDEGLKLRSARCAREEDLMRGELVSTIGGDGTLV